MQRPFDNDVVLDNVNKGRDLGQAIDHQRQARHGLMVARVSASRLRSGMLGTGASFGHRQPLERIEPQPGQAAREIIRPLPGRLHEVLRQDVVDVLVGVLHVLGEEPPAQVIDGPGDTSEAGVQIGERGVPGELIDRALDVRDPRTAAVGIDLGQGREEQRLPGFTVGQAVPRDRANRIYQRQAMLVRHGIPAGRFR